MKSSNTVNNLFLTGCFILFLSSCKQKVSSNWNDKFLLNEMTISEIQDGYENRIFSVREITTLYLDRIQKIDYFMCFFYRFIVLSRDHVSPFDFSKWGI